MNSATSLQDHPALIFLHIPKAAGSTLHAIIERQYPATAIFTVDGSRVQESVAEFKNLPQNRRTALRVVKGHMSFGLHQWLPQPSTYITFLRNPVDRIVSHYYYVLSQPNHYLHQLVVQKKLTLQQYAASGLSVELDNGQSRLLCGIEAMDAVSGDLPCSADVLVSAKRNLVERFSVVGQSDRFDEGLLLLRRLFGWRNVLYRKRNVTENRPMPREIAYETRRFIEEQNALDMELYEFGRQLFDAQIKQYGPGLQRDVRVFRALNQLGAKVYPPVRSAWNKAMSFRTTR